MAFCPKWEASWSNSQCALLSFFLRFISYPRTETNIFPKELNLSALVEQQTQDPNWGEFAQRILDQGGPTPRSGTKSDQAHPPIHPTKYTSNLQVGVTRGNWMGCVAL